MRGTTVIGGLAAGIVAAAGLTVGAPVWRDGGVIWAGRWWHVHAGVPGQEPERPWHIGSVHVGCTRDGQAPSEHGHDTDQMVARWEACACQHQCDRTAPEAPETGGRRWDPKCRARCSPEHCHCPHPCRTETLAP